MKLFKRMETEEPTKPPAKTKGGFSVTYESRPQWANSDINGELNGDWRTRQGQCECRRLGLYLRLDRRWQK